MQFILALLLGSSLCWAETYDQDVRHKYPWDRESSYANPKPCCLPKRWRGKIGDVVGYEVGRRSGAAAAMAFVYTDLGLGKVAAYETVASRDRMVNITAIADLNKQILYIVSGHTPDKCFTMSLPNAKMSQCIPKTAKYIGSPTIGWGNDAVKANTFYLTMRKKNMELFWGFTVTKDCAPVRESGFKRAGNVAKIFSANFFDLKPDIPNAKVFDLPAVCQNMPHFNSDVELTDLQDYLFNIKFTL